MLLGPPVDMTNVKLDPAIRPLVEWLNWLDGIDTKSSCSGHGSPAGVAFVCESLEVLSFVQYCCQYLHVDLDADYQIKILSCYAPPKYVYCKLVVSYSGCAASRTLDDILVETADYLNSNMVQLLNGFNQFCKKYDGKTKVLILEK